MNLKFTDLHKTRTHREVLVKFLLLLGILVAYVGYLALEYDLMTSGIVAGLTWSFFVLCTPVADAGMLLDLPIRIIFGLRMVISEVMVWVIAISANIYALTAQQQAYDATFLTQLLKKIITTPSPYWLIILLSGIGTFLSIYFGDELLDVLRHRDRAKYHQHGFIWKIIAVIALFTIIILSYYFLLEKLNVEISR